MGRKIFVTYKYGDVCVQSLGLKEKTTARHYVDKLQALLERQDHINKGEADGEDLSDFKDSTIASSLRDKIYDSSVTIVVISKAMKATSIPEIDQWIPWEVAYSLKEHSRNGRTSRTNAVLAVALPDEVGSYKYYIEDESCPLCKCRTINTPILFNVLKKNMFNVKSPEYVSCQNHVGNAKVYKNYSSYIHSVKWSDFYTDINKYIEIAEKINETVDQYDISKEV